jgi:hypothetical protein
MFRGSALRGGCPRPSFRLCLPCFMSFPSPCLSVDAAFYANIQTNPPDLPAVISNRGGKTLNLRLRRNALGAPLPWRVLAGILRVRKRAGFVARRAG